MPAIKDEESLLKDVQSYFKSNLNTQISAINTEKADYTIDTITGDDNHYLFAGELYEIPNRTFVNFAITEVAVKSNQNSKISIVSFMVEVVMDNPKKANTYFKSLRYMRAVYETALEYGLSTSEVDGFQVTKALPMETTSVRRNLIISGVEFSCAIG